RARSSCNSSCAPTRWRIERSTAIGPCSTARPRDAEQRCAAGTVARRLAQFDFAKFSQAAMQQNLLRRRIPRVGVGADRFNAESQEPVIDDRGDRFTAVPVTPIRLTEPVPERGFVGFRAGVAIEADAADDTVGIPQRDPEAP